jgi:hypothetical protein
MTRALHRFEAHATIEPGEHELNVDHEHVQLVRVVLTDNGPVIDASGEDEHRRPDVVCPLRPADARRLAQRLLDLADHATSIERTRR